VGAPQVVDLERVADAAVTHEICAAETRQAMTCVDQEMMHNQIASDSTIQ
jgi:hypothetical protein